MITSADEHLIRELALKSGLADIKVCAADEIWPGLETGNTVKRQENADTTRYGIAY